MRRSRHREVKRRERSETRKAELFTLPWALVLQQQTRLSGQRHYQHSSKQCDWRWHLKRPAAEEERCKGDISLPFHLIHEHILGRLPVRQLCQLRCVCKAWNWTLRGADERGEEEYWFLSRSVACGELFAVSTQGYSHPLPLRSSKLLSYLGGRSCSRLAASETAGTSVFSAAGAGGLNCAIVERSHGGFDVIVFNCLTGSVKVLPPPLDTDSLLETYCPGLVCMAVDNVDPGRYYVLLTISYFMNGCGQLYYFEVFDSGTGSWKVGCQPDSATLPCSGLKVPDGDFFNYGLAGNTMIVQAYHVADNAWSSIRVPVSFTCRCSVGAMLKFKGRLLFGQLLGNDDSSYGLGVWELHISSPEAASWVEVMTMPQHHFVTIPSDLQFYRVQAVGHLFYVACFYHRAAGPTIVFDVALKKWWVLSPRRDLFMVSSCRPTLCMDLA